MSSDSLREIVRMRQVTKLYRTNSHRTAGVRDVSLAAVRGELLLVIGPSGSGKTTLLTLVAGLIRPTSGEVFLFEKNLAAISAQSLQEMRAREIGFVFQTFLLIDALSVADNIRMVLRFAGKSKHESRRIASGLLERFGLEHLAPKFPRELSQGEQQRIGVLRAIANEPALVLADEPTASLESKQGLRIISLLHDYAKNSDRCVIVVSHDERIVAVADRVVRITDGII